MPIVFEEVTGEIVPERGRPTQRPAASPRRPARTSVKRCRREIYLMRERERRLHAD